MRNFLLFIAVLFQFLNVKSQTFDINGILIDSTTKQSLPYGNIVIKNSKDSIIKGTLSDQNGKFSIKGLTLKKDQYLLIKYVGYADKKIDLNQANGKKINLGEILMQTDINQMKEATVIGDKYMEQKFDRKVYNINTAKTSSAKDIFDLLRTLPGVTVDLDNNVKYKGAPATIYVDDQPADYVYPKIEMIPVVSVVKIEVIDASLRSGSGKGGIINIKMKSLATDGLSGVAQTNNSTAKFNEININNDYINVNYKYKKIIFFYNLYYMYKNTHRESDSRGTLRFASQNFIQEENAKSDNININSWNSGGVRYSPSNDTRIRLSFGLYNGKSTFSNNNIYSQMYDASTNTLFDKNFISAKSHYNYSGNWLNVSFYHSFDSLGKSLSVYGGYGSNKNNNEFNTDYSYQYISYTPVNYTDRYELNNDNSSSSFYISLFHDHPINSKTRWNFGWNGWTQLNGKGNEINSINDTISYPTSSHSTYNIQQQTADLRIGTTIKKWKLDAGISAQYDKNKADFIRYKTNSEDTLLKINKDHLKALPSVTIVFSPDSINEIKLTYSRSIQTVWYDQLCDFVDKQSPRNWSSGNSKLSPSSYDNIYLGYTLNKPTWNFNTDIFYSLTNNDVSYLTVPVSSVITITTPQNIAHNSSIGLDLSAYASLNQKFNFNFSSSVNHTYISSKDIDGNDLKKKDFGYNIKFSTDARISDKNTATFYINYFSREITFQGYSFDYINSSLSFSHKFFKNSLLFTTGINNIFDNLLKHGSYTDYSGIISTTNQQYTTYVPKFFITLQYKFRQGDRGTKDSGSSQGMRR